MEDPTLILIGIISFGAAMTASIFALLPDGRWHGPLQSMHGYHLVMLTDRSPAYVEEFSVSKSHARRRWMAKQKNFQLQVSLRAMIDEYQVELSKELKDRLTESSL